MIEMNVTFTSGSTKLQDLALGVFAKGASRETTDEAGLPTASRAHGPHPRGAAWDRKPAGAHGPLAPTRKGVFGRGGSGHSPPRGGQERECSVPLPLPWRTPWGGGALPGTQCVSTWLGVCHSEDCGCFPFGL